MQLTRATLAVIAVGAFLATTGPASATPATSADRHSPAADRMSAAPPGYQIVTLPNANVPNFQRRTVYCPGSKRVLGGGAEARGSSAILVGSFPTSDGRGWIGLGRQQNADNVGISVFAICAD
ncbi:hypothetical protein SAMN05421505_113143 [Sinosporangium album]|uniref:Secreted protein n=1 Tax=Sinosporangium album TaxID=504805 RepID=A0A1G8B5Q6_9ACTN|nr:hypothetical protein [Sinosporangium album]SDH28333.1 hypothetical protein SAMN05421505_113143 [Sinosporangium album]